MTAPPPVRRGDGPLIALRGIGKRYATGTVAIQGVDLTIAQGEFLALLGPSGCGKSTLLRIIAGLDTATSGTIAWPARPGATPTASGREIGFVFQEPTLMPWASAAANVALPLRLAGVAVREAEARAAEALAQVGLAGFERAYPRALSGGMKMRVSIARALVTKPRLLLMDEPFAALDEITRHRLNNDLLALWERERFTAIFVTHSTFESVYLAQRILVMAARPGRVAAEIAVDAGYPRGEVYRTSAEYAAHCRAVSEQLGTAMAA